MPCKSIKLIYFMDKIKHNKDRVKREKASKVIKMPNTISKTWLVLVGFFFSPMASQVT